MKNLIYFLSLSCLFMACKDEEPESNFEFPKTFVQKSAEPLETKFYIINATNPENSTEISIDVNNSYLMGGNIEFEDILSFDIEYLTFIRNINFLSDTEADIAIYDGFDFVSDAKIQYTNNQNTYTFSLLGGNYSLEYEPLSQKMYSPSVAVWGAPVGATSIDDSLPVILELSTNDRTFTDDIEVGINSLNLSTGDTLAIATYRNVYE